MTLHFDVAGRLSYVHNCEVCEKYPLEDPTEPCLMCGYSQEEIEDTFSKVEAMNEAYEKYGQEFEDRPRKRSRNAFLHLAEINLGGDFDTITLTDLDMTDDIRGLADLTDHMVEVVIIPTDIVHKGVYGDEEDGYYYEEDDDDE